MTENPTFEPRDGSPTIHVNVRTIRNQDDQEKEIERMWREYKAEEANASQQGSGLHGQQTYDFTPVTTYEYDVVKCADFVEEKGAWVNSMPQEIRDANPQFVPS